MLRCCNDVLEDYNAIEETAYLLRSPANAERLRQSMQ
jgi:PHD/YefM family antitoxin component YafN of YafNO toxin-antitoxin module